MLDWTEQYRPKQLSDIIGNKKSIRSLNQWADSWLKTTPLKKAVILSGSPGIGKTSCVYALALQYQWTPIELNASDARNSARIKAVATAGATHQTFNDDGTFSSTKDGKRKVIILDEADNLYESHKESSFGGTDYGDQGGKKTIIDTIRISHQPIILIVNDYYHLIKGGGDALQSLCLHIKFNPPYPSDIYQLLQRILHQEHIHVDPDVLEALSQRYHGDIRAAVRDLQSLCVDKTHVTFQDFQALGIRDHQKIIFDVLRDIFRTTNIQTIRSAMLHADEDPKLLLHWIAENVPKSYTNPLDISLAYEALSYADRHLGRTSRRNYYGFWSYACDEMGIGVALAKTDQVQQIDYTFPTWLKYMKKRKTSSADEKTLIEKLSKNYHCSTAKTYAFQIAILERIIFHQPDIALTIAKKLSLSDEELQYFGVTLPVRKKEKPSNEKTDDTSKDAHASQMQIHDTKEQTEEQKRQSLLIDF